MRERLKVGEEREKERRSTDGRAGDTLGGETVRERENVRKQGERQEVKTEQTEE